MATSETTDILTVHHLNNSRSQRVLWLLEELEVPYTIKYYKRTPLQRAPPEYIAIHPLGKAPVITDKGRTIAESGAIVEYLMKTYDKTGKYAPQTDDEWNTDKYYLHFSEGSFMNHIVFKYIMVLAPDHVPFFIRPILRPITAAIAAKAVEPSIKAEVKMIEEHLATVPKGAGFAGGAPGRITAADFMMIFGLEAVHELAPDFVKGKEHIDAYVQMIHQRPAYIKALERGGDYAYAK